MAPIDRVLRRYGLRVAALPAPTAPTGIVSFGPPTGFGDTDMPHFFELECVDCGERTSKDVCLYLQQGSVHLGHGCTSTHGAPYILAACYPTCLNPSHLVRKCKGCNLLGSVEITTLGGDAVTGAMVLHIHGIGVRPVTYHPGPGWVGTTAEGSRVELRYVGQGLFAACGEANIIARVDFQIAEMM